MYSKQNQLKRNAPLKPKPFKDKNYLSWLHNQGLECIVCGNTLIELHHLEHGNRGRRDDKIVPLCVEHHRGRFSPHGADAEEFYLHNKKEVMENIAYRFFNQYIEEK